MISINKEIICAIIDASLTENIYRLIDEGKVSDEYEIVEVISKSLDEIEIEMKNGQRYIIKVLEDDD